MPEPAAFTGAAPAAGGPPAGGELTIGGRRLPTRYFLAPLAGYTHLAFRIVVRECGGVGLATTDLVQASHLVAGTKWARELVRTNPEDQPLAVQIYGGVVEHLVAAARWLQDQGYQGIDLNMGCPMAKITGTGGGARLMCRPDAACRLVEAVVQAVQIPVTVKMRLGWDAASLTAPHLAREFENLGVAAITIHGRTRQQGFSGRADLAGIRAVVEAVRQIPVVGNGDVLTVADAWHMRRETGCAAVAIGRGALFDPWIFRRIQLAERGAAAPLAVTPAEQVGFLRRHYELMTRQHGDQQSCLMFRKFAAWYGARLGIPEDLESRLRRFESAVEFAEIADQIQERHGTRREARATAELRLPNGPIEHW